MEQPLTTDHLGFAPPSGANESATSGVSWAAVGAGAIVTAALSLILLALGAGLGLSAVSPWSGVGASASTIGTAVILWLILMQLMCGSLGGYLAGRLRTKWTGIHNDEVYFRDTAHGFLSWGLALVVTAAFLASAATAMVGSARSAGSAGASTSDESRTLDASAYYVDMLFRAPSPAPDSVSAAVRGEVSRIFMRALAQRETPAADRSYVAQVIAARTGLAVTDADTRFSDVLTMAQQASDAVRKATAHSLLWIFLALLIGAFCSSVAATVGGSQRDRVVAV